jgi:restriction system protein
MPARRSSLPWNPVESVEVSPTEYERQVAGWLRKTHGGFKAFRVQHQAKISGSSGEYAFDAIAEFELLGGARFLVLVECKRHARPVERDDVLTLEAKLRDVGGQKAIIFSTAGFQRGAIEYAAQRGIAAVIFIDGKSTYVTKSATGQVDPPPWANIPKLCGWYVSLEEDSVNASLVSDDRIETLKAWISGSLRTSA